MVGDVSLSVCEEGGWLSDESCDVGILFGHKVLRVMNGLKNFSPLASLSAKVL